jgi:hypothetical protein
MPLPGLRLSDTPLRFSLKSAMVKNVDSYGNGFLNANTEIPWDGKQSLKNGAATPSRNHGGTSTLEPANGA